MGENRPESMNTLILPEQIALNAICPYFTMFPLRFPLAILSRLAHSSDVVLDPFCGRGTTNFAARLLGLTTIGVDSSPIAIAMTEAKLATPMVSPKHIISEAKEILGRKIDCNVPAGIFWSSAYRNSVLLDICKLRESLLGNCRSAKRKALRAIMLGALHGPLRKEGTSSYFSNQAPRTYAPKPNYAISFWRRMGCRAPHVDVLEIIAARAVRYYTANLPSVNYVIKQADSRKAFILQRMCAEHQPKFIITSPPYYGLRTYVSDQWLRNWFLGGPETVDYSYGVQLSHRGKEAFVNDLRAVWLNIASVSHKRAQLIFRFGAINDRHLDPREIIKASLKNTPWQLSTIVDAGTASRGKRQADSFGHKQSKAIAEFDAWAIRA